MAIEIDDVLNEEIDRACEDRREQVRDLNVYKRVIAKLLREVRRAEDGGEPDLLKIIGFMKQLETHIYPAEEG